VRSRRVDDDDDDDDDDDGDDDSEDVRSRSGTDECVPRELRRGSFTLNSSKRARRVERILRGVEQGDARDVCRVGVRLVW